MPFAAWAQSGDEDDARKDTNWQEAAHTLPARPDERNLLAFRVGSQPEGRFFVDPESISRGEDDVIRYVLVMRGSGGASTVTFEGVRCGVRARRLYASLERDGGWRAMKNSAWRDLPVQGSSIVMFGYSGNDPRAVLAYDYLCDGPAPRAREDIIARLRGKRIDYLDPGHGVEP
ncbi:MAG: CNP1-like family protein [Azoarcus sp.]|jgi:hypothetical protein|nr:CNP1-like family protein [Azoarcus sp.]